MRDGVGEHTDYGLLTLLRQDSVGGLQVRTAAGWIEAPPVAGSFVCNIGDMLDRMTGGLLPEHAASRPPQHAAAATGCRSRCSSIPTSTRASSRSAAPRPTTTRRAGTAPACMPSRARYGDYLLGKIGKVFPDLKRSVL